MKITLSIRLYLKLFRTMFIPQKARTTNNKKQKTNKKDDFKV